jgi:hypothetical protein
MKNYDNDKQRIQQYAKNVLEIEGKYDYSMDTKFMDMLVTDYVNLKCEKVREIIDAVFELKEKFTSYGDADTGVRKIKLKDIPEPDGYYKRNSEVTIEAFFMSDNCTSSPYDKFVVIREVKERVDRECRDDYRDVHYHIRLVKEEKKSYKYKDVLQYGDLRDRGYVVTLEKQWYDEEFKVKDEREMLYFYQKFELFYRNIKSVGFELGLVTYD